MTIDSARHIVIAASTTFATIGASLDNLRWRRRRPSWTSRQRYEWRGGLHL